MRDFKGMKRQRGRNRGGGGNQGGGGKPQHNINRAFDSNGPDNIKVRGNAQHVYEKYQALARDAALAGDRVLGENHLQHAEHYFRTLRAIQPTRAASEIVSRDTSSNGDIDFEDEAVETAMEEADAQAAARAADALNQPQPPPSDVAEVASAAGGDTQRFDRDQGQRPWRDRPQGEFRDRNDRPFNDRDRQDRPQQGEFRGERQGAERQGAERQGGERPGAQPQNGEFRSQDRNDRPRYRDRDDRFRDRQDRPQGEGSGERQDRPQGEFRGDRQGGQGQASQGQGGQGQGGQGQQGEPRDRQDRTERPRFRERDDRRFEPRETDAAPAGVDDAAGSAPARDEPSAPVLRSEDGGVSQLPGFLQAAPSSASPSTSTPEEGERPRRPRRRRTREDGEIATAPPEVEEA